MQNQIHKGYILPELYLQQWLHFFVETGLLTVNYCRLAHIMQGRECNLGFPCPMLCVRHKMDGWDEGWRSTNMEAGMELG